MQEANPYESPVSTPEVRSEEQRYSAGALKVVDLLAIVLAGFGATLAWIGPVVGQATWLPCGGVLLCLGLALNAKLAQLRRKGEWAIERKD